MYCMISMALVHTINNRILCLLIRTVFTLICPMHDTKDGLVYLKLSNNSSQHSGLILTGMDGSNNI